MAFNSYFDEVLWLALPIVLAEIFSSGIRSTMAGLMYGTGACVASFMLFAGAAEQGSHSVLISVLGVYCMVTAVLTTIYVKETAGVALPHSELVFAEDSKRALNGYTRLLPRESCGEASPLLIETTQKRGVVTLQDGRQETSRDDPKSSIDDIILDESNMLAIDLAMAKANV